MFASTRTSPLAVDVDAERVLALAFTWEEIAALEHGAVVEADSVERASRERHEVGALE